MKTRDIFALCIRIIGLVSVIYLLATSLFFFGAGVPWQLVVRSILLLLVSIWFIRGAPQLVRFAYRDGE